MSAHAHAGDQDAGIGRRNVCGAVAALPGLRRLQLVRHRAV